MVTNSGHQYHVNWQDRQGVYRITEYELLLEHCTNGQQTLSQTNAAMFEDALDRYQLEIKMGRSLPFTGRVHRLECRL
jgi:hypothetical protein